MRGVTCTVGKRRRDREGVNTALVAGFRDPGAPLILQEVILPSEWPRTRAPGLEFFRLFISLLPKVRSWYQWGEMIPACSVFTLSNRHKVCGWRHHFGVSEIRIVRRHHPFFGILLESLLRGLGLFL